MTLCYAIWESVNSLAAVAFTVLCMYEFNRPLVHFRPTPAPTIGGLAGGTAVRRLDGQNAEPFDLSPCTHNYNDLSDHLRLEWITPVVAVVLILDQLMTLRNVCFRRGNMFYYMAWPDSLFNLATTLVQSFSACGIVMPNMIGAPARQVARLFLCCKPCNRVPRDLDMHGEFDNTICDVYADGCWEMTVSLFVILEFIQSVFMYMSDCHAGPTLQMGAYDVPSINLKEWEDQDQVIVNIMFYLFLIFCVNVLYQYFCDEPITESIKDSTKAHYLIIMIQSALFLGYAEGLPVPTALGRIVRPLFIWAGCVRRQEYTTVNDKTAEYFEKALDEYKTAKQIAKDESAAKANGCGCNRKDPMASWQC